MMWQTGCLNGDVLNSLAINDGRSFIPAEGQIILSITPTSNRAVRQSGVALLDMGLDMEGASGRYVIYADLVMQFDVLPQETRWRVAGADINAGLVDMSNAPIKRQQGQSDIDMILNTHDKMQFSFLHRAKRGHVATLAADVRSSTLREDD